MTRDDRGFLSLQRLVLLESAAALAVAGMLLGGGAFVAACAGAALLLLACPRRNGRPLPDRIAEAVAHHNRTRTSATRPPTTAPTGPGSPLPAVAPALRPFPYTAGREEDPIGMIGDGSRLIAVLQVEAGDENPGPRARGHALRSAHDGITLPLGLLTEALQATDVPLASVQLVQQVRPAVTPRLPPDAVPRLAYAPHVADTAIAALRLTWVALRLDPELCPEAVAARGGAGIGSQRCLALAARRLTVRLRSGGFRPAVLSQSALHSALSTAACMPPHTPAGPAPAVEANTLHSAGLRHASNALGPLPARPTTPFAALLPSGTDTRAYATTLSLTLRSSTYRDSLCVDAHLRSTALTADDLHHCRQNLERACRSARIPLTHLDRQQLPGLLATLPLGGPTP
ncbi:type VII secretion protein EccE [Streptomyces triticagri]|uniref:type VII secretion protein EccE n=1 Tax=Streptomyces triticagri TaxID=2293568 RepID=UPI0013149703|nr:type VII secretion protein EccE [Streptomyces triticagri]